MKKMTGVLIFCLSCFFGCSQQGTPYNFNLPPDFKAPKIPEDNFLSQEKVQLGRFLFYDKSLSINMQQSCATCHKQENGFAEALATSVGATGELLTRNASTLTNVAYNASFTWAHPNLKELERQILIPLFNEDPIELGLSGNEKQVLTRLSENKVYPQLFGLAFAGEKKPLNMNNVVKALASFVRSLISFNSRFDRYAWYGEDSALNESELRGLSLFMSEKLECRHCHGGFNFTHSNSHSFNVNQREFHNTGLYNPQKNLRFDEGVFNFSGLESDRGRFRPPTLRNIEYTAPYMHDGSIDNLDKVIDFYAAGGRNVVEGRFAGDGRQHPNKSLFLHGFTITKEEKKDLIAFLKSLSDESFIQDSAHSNPFDTNISSQTPRANAKR